MSIWKDYSNLILQDGEQAMLAINLERMVPRDACDPFDERIGALTFCEYYWKGPIVSVLVYRLLDTESENDSLKGELLPDLCYWYFGDNFAQALRTKAALRSLDLNSVDQVVIEYQNNRLPFREFKSRAIDTPCMF